MTTLFKRPSLHEYVEFGKPVFINGVEADIADVALLARMLGARTAWLKYSYNTESETHFWVEV